MEEDSTKPEITYDRDDELGRLTATLKYLSESAGHSNEYQRKFISNISHDFRSPLTSIKGYVEAMLDGTISPEMQERYLGIVLSETERLNKLTEGLLLLNSFDDQRIYLDLTEFDILRGDPAYARYIRGTLPEKNLGDPHRPFRMSRGSSVRDIGTHTAGALQSH